MELREFRAEQISTDDEGRLEGLVAPFGRETVIGDLSDRGFHEKIAPSAFRKSLAESDVLLLDNHDMTRPLARKSAGNLELREASDGLQFSATPADTSYGRDLRANIKAGNIRGMSFGFTPVKEDWFDDEGAPSNRHVGTHRVLREVKLIEVSAVTRPAYSGTLVSARAVDEARGDEDRAAPVNTAKRKSLAAKGHALPDGSYPIPDVSHLHAAAVLAASHHGNWQAAKRLIRKRAKALGVDVSTLPGFGKKSSRSADDARDERALGKSSKKRVLQIDAELKAAIDLFHKVDVDKLPQEAQEAVALITSSAEHSEHIVHKEKLNGDDLAGSRSQGKPGSPTSDEDERRFDSFRAARYRALATELDCAD